MSERTSSTLSELLEVTAAIKHLQEFGNRLAPDWRQQFRHEDIVNIDGAVSAIQDLVTECSKLHDKLETETIHASILRHKLKYFPGEIEEEIKRAIYTARQLNQSELGRLQNQSEVINSNIQSLEKQFEDLDKENEFLVPERDRVRVLHEDIIMQLNQRMSDKASMQIHLNETRDSIRETNQQIIDLEEGILSLKEDLIKDRSEARNEKKRMKREMYDTTIKLNAQNERNAVKKEEMDGLYSEVTELSTKLADLRSSTMKYERSINKLEAREGVTTSNLQKTNQLIEEVKKVSSETSKKIKDDKKNFRTLKTNLNNQISQLENDMSQEIQQAKKLTEENKCLKIELKEKIKIGEEDSLKIRETNASLQERKSGLTKKSEEVARFCQDVSGIMTNMTELDRTHQVIMGSLRSQIDESRKILSKERMERMENEEAVKKLEKEMDDLREESVAFINSCQDEIVNGKKDHSAIMQEGSRLQQLIKDNREQINQLQVDLAQATQQLDQLSNQTDEKVKYLKNQMDLAESNTDSLKQKISEQMPEFLELEEFHKKRTIEYEQSKREIVASKTRKQKLEESIKQIKLDIDKLIKPQASLHLDLQNARESSVQKLQENLVKLAEVEQQLYVISNRLARINSENDRFVEANAGLQADITKIVDDKKYNEDLSIKLLHELNQLRAQLIQAWFVENKIQEEKKERDQVTVDLFDQLLLKTSLREETVSTVTKRLQSELLSLGSFLEKAAHRRPKSTATKQRLRTVEKS